jgi:hypothetical protein
VRAVIVHSPLVGPATVVPLAEQLVTLDMDVDVPDLRDAVESPARFVQRAIEAAAGVDLVIGHSGAGAFLPAIAAADATTSVFVDAVVPGRDTSAPSRPFVELLAGIPTQDGLLAP